MFTELTEQIEDLAGCCDGSPEGDDLERLVDLAQATKALDHETEMPEERQRQRYMGRPATLADHENNEFKVQPICRRCWHTGPVVSPRELADRFGLPMASAIPAVEARLRCARCGERAGYLAIENPAVSGRGC